MFLMSDNKWARLLAYATGLVNQKSCSRMSTSLPKIGSCARYFPARVRLSDPERFTLAEIAKRLGRTALQQVACVAKPDTILAYPVWSKNQAARE
jgi:hypothetical protein